MPCLKKVTFILIFILVGFTYGCASYPFEGWNSEDTYRQLTFTALHAVDWSQTLGLVNNPEYQEANAAWAIGKHPSEASVHLYMAACLIFQTAAPAMLTPKYRKWWQYIWIGEKSYYVNRNYSIGLKGDF